MSLQGDYTAAAEEIVAKQAALSGLLTGVTELSGTKATERVDEIRKANTELTELGERRDALGEQVKEIEKAQDAVKASRQPGPRQVNPTNDDADADDEDIYSEGIKSVRQMLRGSEGYQAAIKGGRSFRGHLGTLALKTLITSADQTPQAQRLGAVQLMALEERTVADLMLQGTTTAQKIEYFEETTFTNAAVEVAEGAIKPEGALDFTLREDDVRKIAVWIPVTDEMLADVAGFESYLRERLGFMVRRREEQQLLVGDGTAPNISGITDRSGIQTQAKGADSTPDAIFKAIQKIRVVAFSEPTAVVLHPNDWTPIRLLTTADGIYIWGPPMDAGPERIFSLPIRLTTAMTENTGLVGAFRPHAQVYRRSGIDIAISTENEDYFLKNKVAVRAEERLALAVYRPAAFCTVTGI